MLGLTVNGENFHQDPYIREYLRVLFPSAEVSVKEFHSGEPFSHYDLCQCHDIDQVYYKNL